MLPITTLFLLILPSKSFVNMKEVYSLSSVVSTVSIVVDPSAGIRLIVVALLVALLSGAIPL